MKIEQYLLAEIRENNVRAFDTLFTKYYAQLCVFAMRYLDRDDAEEVVQNVMIWFWENRHKLQISTSLKSYLYGSVRNKCVTHINRNKIQEKAYEKAYSKLNLTVELPEPDDVEEMMEKLEVAIANLPDSYREALMMNRFDKKTYQEIAERLRVSPKTIDYRIRQAYKMLRTKLQMNPSMSTERFPHFAQDDS